MYCTNKKAFTMIELIFVIVIIGVLAAVAIPKLAANKDNATGSMCTHEVDQLIHEISNAYLAGGYVRFINANIDDISNVKTSVSTGNGITEASTTKIDTTGVTYKCDGEGLMYLVGNYVPANNSYELRVTDMSPTRPATLNAAIQLRQLHGISSGGTRVFTY
ncbi:MAG: type II secretion system GspH family protein [Sulfurovum sp.]|nr:type II secretion system GspH family protein [Sulfurovum sp.]